MLQLPKPSQSEQQLSAQLRLHIQQQIIAAGGQITFADYMQAALYAPGLGYYVAGKTKFGGDGDFVTGPEISPYFSYCIAKQTQQVLAEIDNGIILEFGAGSGVMAADILDYLQQHNSLPEQYWILEPSPDLQQLQKETITNKVPELLSKVSWLHQLPHKKFSGVVLANEVLDAMPVNRIEYDGEQFQQLMVDEHFQYQKADITSDELLQAATALPFENFTEGYQTEINLWLSPWLNSVADALQQGVILLIDYGYPRAEYYHSQRTMGTLLCHYRHHAHNDALANMGIQDITAHVDFTAVAEAADAARLSVLGYCHQAAFLLSCGIQDMAVKSRDIQQLIMPAAMGEAFKVMALSHDVELDLMGFSMLDQRGKL